jgi:carboxyl-terminal processing protease
MRKIFISLCAGTLLVASLSAPSVLYAQGAEALSVEARERWQKDVDVARLYDAVVETIDRRFYDEGILKKLDWRARAQALRPSVLSAATPQDAVRQINELLSELKTSHTGLFTPDDYEYYILLDVVGAGPELAGLMSRRFWGTGPYYPGVGAFTRRVEGRHFVDGILEGSPADRAGLKYGDEILSVDGAPYTPVAAFVGKAGTTVRLEIRRAADAAPESLSVEVIPITPTKAFADAAVASARVIEREGAQIGYVHVWALSEQNSFRTAVAGFDQNRAMADRLARQETTTVPNNREAVPNTAREMPKRLDFLIVDVRGRVGGNIAVANQHLQMLGQENPYWGQWHTFGRRDTRGPLTLSVGQNPSFRGRSALLIDHHTRSAAEIMAYGYKRSAFGPVIGTPSAGAVVSGSLVPMPGDLLLYVAVTGHEFDGGYRLEGIGVMPDHRVERPLSYAGGADPVLDAAVELLAKQKAKAP